MKFRAFLFILLLTGCDHREAVTGTDQALPSALTSLTASAETKPDEKTVVTARITTSIGSNQTSMFYPGQSEPVHVVDGNNNFVISFEAENPPKEGLYKFVQSRPYHFTKTICYAEPLVIGNTIELKADCSKLKTYALALAKTLIDNEDTSTVIALADKIIKNKDLPNIALFLTIIGTFSDVFDYTFKDYPYHISNYDNTQIVNSTRHIISTFLIKKSINVFDIESSIANSLVTNNPIQIAGTNAYWKGDIKYDTSLYNNRSENNTYTSDMYTFFVEGKPIKLSSYILTEVTNINVKNNVLTFAPIPFAKLYLVETDRDFYVTSIPEIKLPYYPFTVRITPFAQTGMMSPTFKEL